MRAVNADDLIHELDKDGIMEYGYVSVFGIPIIEDCVPVVRCKNCKYGEADDPDFPDQYLCHVHGCDWNEGDHFCSNGKEKVKERR